MFNHSISAPKKFFWSKQRYRIEPLDDRQNPAEESLKCLPSQARVPEGSQGTLGKCLSVVPSSSRLQIIVETKISPSSEFVLVCQKCKPRRLDKKNLLSTSRYVHRVRNCHVTFPWMSKSDLIVKAKISRRN